MIFSCTKKVLDIIKKYKEVENIKEEDGFYNWYVDVIIIERKKHLLFTHSESLFSFFIHLGAKSKILKLEYLFQEKLRQLVIREIGSAEKYQEEIIPKEPKSRFVKTNSRKILGSMNEIKYQIDWMLESGNELKSDHNFIHHKINEVIMGGINYKTPRTMMLEMLQERIKKQ